jgi:hypothetical protein
MPVHGTVLRTWRPLSNSGPSSSAAAESREAFGVRPDASGRCRERTLYASFPLTGGGSTSARSDPICPPLAR